MDEIEHSDSHTVEVLLNQYVKDLSRKLNKLANYNLPEEAQELVDEMLSDATEIYGKKLQL